MSKRFGPSIMSFFGKRAKPDSAQIVNQPSNEIENSGRVELKTSACKLLKNYLRNRCAQERLSALALMYIHKDMDIDVNDVIDMFARKHKRNLNFMS